MPAAIAEIKNKILESPLEVKDEQEKAIEKPDYSDEEELYIKNLRGKLESAKNARDTQHQEFDGMDYVTYYDQNERLANTFIKPKENKEDTHFQSGTIRQKLMALLSAVNNLNLSGDISAFDSQGLQVQALGDAMEDIVLKTKELDNDDEKKLMRHYELLKQGSVFVEELWDERMKIEKKMSKKFSGDIKAADWTKRLKKAFARPSRNIIPGINVYLGDITIYSSTDQPYIFTVDKKPYEVAKLIFGKWERWQNVPKKVSGAGVMGTTRGSSVVDPDWRLLETEENYCEIIRYQDKWNNEFAVLINGVLMTPIGLPLPWGYEDYNITQQNLEPIHSKFAYGKSLVFRVRTKVAILDEMMRACILKTQKSLSPPSINNSGRVLSNRIFMPGKILYGVPFDSIRPINAKETEGITRAELEMIKELQQSIDQETVSPTFQGQKTEGGTTATEIIELQRQAKMLLGLTVFAVSMLEWKLEWLRLHNILANWFNAEDQVVDEARKTLRSKFRNVSVERMIEGAGLGRRMVIPTKEGIPSPKAIRTAEKSLSKEQGVPIQLIFLDPDEVTSSKLVWMIAVRPKEKKTSETEKLLFREFAADALPLGASIPHLQERFASVWGEDPQKLFPPEAGIPPPAGEEGQGQGAQSQRAGRSTLSSRVNMPTAESALNRQVRTALGATA